MDLIKADAESLIRKYIDHGISDFERLIQKVSGAVQELESDAEVIRFYTIVMEANQKAYESHLPKCTNLESCPTNHKHERFARALRKELSNLGIQSASESFTTEEKKASEEILEQLLKDIKDLKYGQQVIYDDLYAEIQDLKNWFILGKKNWKQLYLGKLANMVASGVIGETVAKPLVNVFDTGYLLK